MGQFVDFIVTSLAAQKYLPASRGVPGCLVLTAGQCPTTLETQDTNCDSVTTPVLPSIQTAPVTYRPPQAVSLILTVPNLLE